MDEFSKSIIHALKNSEIKSRCVTGRGTLTMDPKELARSEKFLSLCRKGLIAMGRLRTSKGG